MVYYLGFVFVLLLIFISIDDVIWDIYYIIGKILGRFKRRTITFMDVETTKPKMLAILVAAYKEENVLGEVIENMVESNHYPDSMYHIFLGVYPNDPETQKVADELESKFENVHKVVHYLPGPSSKADNLNNIIENIKTFEKENNLEFAAIVIHDSEDIIHPYEFKLENYLLEEYEAIQMPVFPLHEKTNIRNLFGNIISGTYADEFAENHYRMLVSRTDTDAFVPSAGTGFVIRRDILESYPDSNVFPVGSLTEDYKLSLEFKKKGFNVHYALEDVQKTLEDGSVVKEFISIRSMFPSSYEAAVRQKTRWIYGITMQSFSLKEIFRNENLNFQSKYTLYRDWKAKFGNMLLGPGYLIFFYFILSLFFNLPVMYPKYSPSWYLMVILSIIMIERQVLRFIAINGVYGIKSAVFSLLVPPLLPIKMVIGNIINFNATLRAWKIKFSINTNRRPKKVRWSKTDHQFLEEQILLGFRRNLGDVLLYYNFVTEKELKTYMNQAEKEGLELADYIRKEELIPERNIVRAICEIEDKTYMRLIPGRYLNEYVKDYGEDRLKFIEALPLIKLEDTMTVVTTLDSDKELIKEKLGEENIIFIYTSREELMKALEEPEIDDIFEGDIKLVEEYIKSGLITLEQGLLALGYNKKEDHIEDTLNEMGLLKNIKQEIKLEDRKDLKG